MKLFKLKVINWEFKSLGFRTTWGILFLIFYFLNIVTSQEGGHGSQKGTIRLPVSAQSEYGSLSKSQIYLFNQDTKRSKYTPKGRRDKDKPKTSQIQNPPDSPEMLTQLFTKWMSYDTVTKTEHGKSLNLTKSPYPNWIVRLSSQIKQWLSSRSNSESGRTFLLAPLLTAIPVLAAEIFAIGGIGLMAPLVIIFPILLLPLLALAFIILI